MAHLVPSDISRLALAGGDSPELDTLRLLAQGLSHDYTVFHAVHWSRAYGSRSYFGEIDFVVLNQSGEVLLVEQKNGVLEETGDGLVKRYDDTSKNVVRQLHRSVDNIRGKYAFQHGGGALLLHYLLYCPDHRIADVNAAGLDASRIVDSAGDLVERIEALLGPGLDRGDGHRRRVHEFFCQTFELRPDVGAHIDRQDRAFVRQVGTLSALFDNLVMEPYRLRVTGTAGCGKSLLAQRFVERAAGDGKRALLLCFNRPLGDLFRESMPAGAMADTFHGFCNAFLTARGETLDFETLNDDPAFWRRVQERVLARRVPDEWRFDALAIDEGQDFEPDWWEIARLFLREDAPVLWLEDPDQNLYGKEAVPLPGFVGYRARVNYRSPERIARYLRRALPFSFEPGNALTGRGVRTYGYAEPAQQPAIVAGIVERLLAEGFGYDEIAIVSCHGMARSAFSEVDSLGGVRVRRFAGEYDDEGRQSMSDGPLLAETLYRFKGRGAPAVILVDVDPDPERLAHWYRLLYCGMTRASVRLDVLVRTGNPIGEKLMAAV